MERKKAFAGYWHYGVILTYTSAASGVAGIFLSVCLTPFYGLICMFISAVCDSLDGMVASTRKGRTEDDKRFGSRIDMLSDIIAFGLTPIAVGFGAGMREWYFIVLFGGYITSSIIRLAYFEVTEDLRIANGGEKRKYYEGLPLAAIVPALFVFYLVATIFNQTARKIILTVCYALCMGLFILKFKFPKFGKKGLLITLFVLLGLIALILTLRYTVLTSPLF